ncbi:MAG: GxGYxYP family putative glycoside hydrolase, partial [Armatimonadetes bacterium]|nr:GxGYxYP family putative glycoside hydrolase [Armatimonadota bacterium]
GAPFVLSPMRQGVAVQSYSVPAGVGGFFFLGAADLPPEDQVTGVLAVEDGGEPVGFPVAILRHGCQRFRGAIDVWAGTQWLCDPRDPAEVLLARQLILRSTIWVLEASGSLAPEEARPARARLEQWCAKHLLPARQPLKYSGRPRPRLLPACPTLRPGAEVIVHSVATDPQDVRVALACLQGHVNRRQPRLYLEYTEHDAKWLDWYQERGYVGQVERVESADELLSRFRSEVAGAVVYEEEYLNIATMLASVRGGVACTPDLARRWSLPVIADLRGRWRSQAEAYRWAFDRLWPQMNHQVLCHGHPRRSPQQTDYLVAHRIFTFFISGAVDGADVGKDPVQEMLLAEKVLAAAEPNSTVIGWWGWGDPPEGIGEYWGMTLASRYAKVTIGTEFMTNMSFHSAVPGPRRFRQEHIPREPRVSLDESKIYAAAAVLDSGNDPWYWLRPQRDVWEAPGRGETALGWIIGPTLYDLAPGILEWYYRHLTPRDELICALSGLGYMNIPDYATAFADRDAVLRDFLAMTQLYMRRLDLRTLQTYHGSWGEPSDYGRHGDLARFARFLDGLVALLPDVGRHDTTTYPIANYFLPGHRGRGQVPVFHCLTRWIPWYYSSDLVGRPEDAEIAGLVKEIRSVTPRERPAFILAFVLSWTFKPEMVNAAARELGPEYIFVTPSELAALFRKYKADCR